MVNHDLFCMYTDGRVDEVGSLVIHDDIWITKP